MTGIRTMGTRVREGIYTAPRPSSSVLVVLRMAISGGMVKRASSEAGVEDKARTRPVLSVELVDKAAELEVHRPPQTGQAAPWEEPLVLLRKREAQRRACFPQEVLLSWWHRLRLQSWQVPSILRGRLPSTGLAVRLSQVERLRISFLVCGIQ